MPDLDGLFGLKSQNKPQVMQVGSLVQGALSWLHLPRGSTKDWLQVPRHHKGERRGVLMASAGTRVLVGCLHTTRSLASEA